jgi:hypothetical protein
VHRASDRSGLGRRARHVEQEQHREVAPAPQAVEVHGLVGHRSCPHFDPGFYRGIDVDVVALRLPVATVQTHAEP